MMEIELEQNPGKFEKLEKKKKIKVISISILGLCILITCIVMSIFFIVHKEIIYVHETLKKVNDLLTNVTNIDDRLYTAEQTMFSIEDITERMTNDMNTLIHYVDSSLELQLRMCSVPGYKEYCYAPSNCNCTF